MNKTILYDQHVQLGAKMVPFGQWEMPVWYSTHKQEHLAVRHTAGLFDISHMGLLKITGENAFSFLSMLSCNSLNGIEIPKMVYSMMCNEQGHILDDVMIGGLPDGGYLLVVNAGNKAKILDWIQTQVPAGVTIEDLNKTHGFMALQGPKAIRIFETILADKSVIGPRFGTFSCELLGVPVMGLRTGYTGEDGVELIVPSEKMAQIWTLILQKGANPCGLAARDSLRIEAGLPLYGQELSESLTPWHTRYKWVVKFDHDFIGAKQLKALKEKIQITTVGLELLNGMIARPGCDIKQGGKITSGTRSPITGKSIAMAIVPINCAKIDTPLTVEIRQKEHPAKVVPVPFK